MSESAPTAWARFLSLRFPEKADFFLSLLLLPSMHVALRLLGTRWMKTYLQLPANAKAEHAAGDETGLAKGRRAAAMVGAASRRGILRGNCLSQSLALCFLLRRRGTPAVLRIGGKKDAQAFEAHAWVELDGVALNDSSGLRSEFSFFEQPAKQVSERISDRK